MSKQSIGKKNCGDFTGGPVMVHNTLNAGHPGSNPGQGPRFYMVQLGVHMLQLNILHDKQKIEEPACLN